MVSKKLLILLTIMIVSLVVIMSNRNRTLVHPSEPMALTLPSTFSICARPFGEMYAVDGDSEEWFPDDCIATDVSGSIVKLERQREVGLSIGRVDSVLQQWEEFGGLQSTVIASQTVRFDETVATSEGVPQSVRTLAVEYKTAEGWVYFRADGTAEGGEIADLTYAWEAIETFIKHYRPEPPG